MNPEPPLPGTTAVPHDWRPARFMVIAAHPDDADFGPAATAAALDRRGIGRLARLLHERRRRAARTPPPTRSSSRRRARRSSAGRPASSATTR